MNNRELMKEAIFEAKKSNAEDGRIHPKVGAVLADSKGNIILRAHRGENNDGGHSEYLLLEKAKNENIDLIDTSLFVTLEPCTSRGSKKTPCAQRIIDSDIMNVYIGMLDPNPIICGRGETYLRSKKIVERFPSDLVKEIEQDNKDFIEQYKSQLLPDNSLYVKKQISELVTDYLNKKGLSIFEIPYDWDLHIDDLIQYISSNQNGVCNQDIIREARKYAYDSKYSDYDYDSDARSIDHSKWRNQIYEILNVLNVEKLNDYKIIDVGVGNGVEAKELFDDYSNITLVDIGEKSLSNAKLLCPNSRIVNNEAENLCDITTCSQDIYLALRVYQSSYFNIEKAILEAYRVLVSRGIIVVSIANGFLNSNRILIPGLVVPKSNFVDRNRPFELSEKIRRKLTQLKFEEIGIRTTLSEIYIYARKGI